MSPPLRWSLLRHMHKSPLAYRYALEHPGDPTAPMRLGTAGHCAILRPLDFSREYVIAPPTLDRRTKEGRAWADDHAGVEVLSASDGASVEGMAAAIAAHPLAASWLREAPTVERRIEWTIEGRECAGTPDAVGPGVLVDLKTTRSLDRFGSHAYGLLYHGQLAWYAEALELLGNHPREVRIIAVESSPPHDVACYVLADDLLDEGCDLCRTLLDRLTECERTGYWPGAYPDPIELRAPPWAHHDEDDLSDLEGL